MTNPRRRTSTQASGVLEPSTPAPAQPGARTRKLALRLRLPLGVALGYAMLAAPAQAAGKLVLYPDPATLVILIIGFVILIAPINATIFRPLFRVLDERDAKIAGAIRQAEGLVARAAELTEQYRGAIREAREVAEVARKQQLEAARSEYAVITGDARTESEDEIGRARREIESSLAQARTTLERTSGDLAKIAAERILGRSLQ